MLILGFNSTHDASAALLGDGRLLCAVEEERFSRRKHHYGFPEHAIDACLRTAGVTWKDIDRVTFYWNPFRGIVPFGFHFLSHLPASARYLDHQPGIWRAFLGLRGELRRRYGYRGPLRFHDHHLNHLASSCFPSGFEEASALTVDGTGEWETTVLAHFRDGKIHRQGYRLGHPKGDLAVIGGDHRCQAIAAAWIVPGLEIKVKMGPEVKGSLDGAAGGGDQRSQRSPGLGHQGHELLQQRATALPVVEHKHACNSDVTADADRARAVQSEALARGGS